MRRIIFILLACLLTTAMQAQRVTHTYNNVSLSDALRQLSEEQHAYTIYFLYNELEDFRVTTTVRNKTLPEAIQQVIGFYPIRMTVSAENKEIFVECIQKTDRHLTGTIIDENGQPVPYANITLLSPKDSTLLTGGVSNESGYFAIPYDLPIVIARITYIGYKTVWRRCERPQQGTIRIHPDTYSINGVVVKGEIPQYKMTQGGMTVDVQHSILHDVGTQWCRGAMASSR